MPTPCRTDGRWCRGKENQRTCLESDVNFVIWTNKFMSYSTQQQQLVTVVHKEVLKYRGINTEVLSRYWTCKTPSMLPKRQFSKLEYGEYRPTNTQPRLVMCMISKWVLEYRTLYHMSYCSWALSPRLLPYLALDSTVSGYKTHLILNCAVVFCIELSLINYRHVWDGPPSFQAVSYDWCTISSASQGTCDSPTLAASPCVDTSRSRCR